MVQTNAPYTNYAQFYDFARGDRSARVATIQDFIDTAAPQARSVMELACGTAAILYGLRPGYELAGLDNSMSMLRFARIKLPNALLVHADMTQFNLGRQFDVIFCTFNSLDHLLTIEAWEQCFAQVVDHLRTGGVFIFDVNTRERLEAIASHSPWSQEVPDGSTLAGSLQALGNGDFVWESRYKPAVSGPELAETTRMHIYPPEQIAALTRKFFQVERVVTGSGDPFTNEDAGRTYYICRKA